MLAEAVADGESIDWAAAESSAVTSEQRDLIRQLHAVADLAELNRRAAGGPSFPSAELSAGQHSSNSAPALIEKSDQARLPLKYWGPLQILEEIGSGSFGTVYKALDTRLDRMVALKLLRSIGASEPARASTVTNEGRLLAQIRHQNVVTIFGADCFDGCVGLWMEFVNGRTLMHIQQEQGLFSAQEAMLVGLAVCRALAAVHKAGFLHRDIKAQNVMREAGGRIVLMDFGAGEPSRSSDVRQTRLKGTPLYLSPELLTGEDPSAASDIYALGVLLYHMVTGAYPVEGHDLDSLRQAHLLGRATRLHDVGPELPDGFVRTIERALAPDQQRRFSSAGSMKVALSDALGLGFAQQTVRQPPASFVIAKSSDARPSIAVLPFSDMSPQHDQDYFCEGMAEELINALSSLTGVRVAARSSAFQFKAHAQDIRRVGEQLNVHTILEGSVRRAGNRLRVVAQLINVSDGYHMWSERYDRELDDVFAVQDEIARAIVEKLKVKLGGKPDAPLVKRHTEDLEAYNLYLQGRYYWSRRYAGFLQRAIGCFEQAIDQDESYALAHAGLADAFSLLAVYEILPPRVAIAKASLAAKRAVQLDDASAEAHQAMALVRWYFDWDYTAALREYERALALNPSSGVSHSLFGILLADLGHFDEAIAEVTLGRTLEPLSALVAFYAASTFAITRPLDEALSECQKVLDLDPGFLPGLWVQATVLSHLGRHDEAIDAAVRAVTLSHRQNFYLGRAASAYAAAGRDHEAKAIVDELHERAGQAYVSPLCFAEIATALGDVDQGFKWLERAYEDRSPFLVALGVSPMYDALRGDPRFPVLLKKLGLQGVSPAVRR
jgi:eukaryotic-like serine/threonine-protein kinase